MTDVRNVRPADLQSPHPIYCVWEITLACDLACRHCGSRAGRARRDELSTAEALDLVDQLAEIGVREVALIGGEAYLRPDWDVIAAAIVARGMRCEMVSGGRGLDDERVGRAASAGMHGISVSIDGLQATHDRLRAVPGSFQAALAALQRIRAAGMRPLSNTQINRLSAPELEAIARLLVEQGVVGWQIQFTVAMGRAADRAEILVQPWELLEIFPRLVAIRQQILDPARVHLFPANNVGYFGPYESELRSGGREGRHWTGCPAGTWAIGIEADGAIKGCPSLPSVGYTGGHIRERRLADIVRQTPELTHLGQRGRDDLWGHCGTCYYADVCKGGCSWTAHSLLGRPGNNPICIHRAMQLRRQGRRERLVQVQRAPGQPFDVGRFELIEEPWPTDSGGIAP